MLHDAFLCGIAHAQGQHTCGDIDDDVDPSVLLVGSSVSATAPKRLTPVQESRTAITVCTISLTDRDYL